ncbi:MAG TPA: polysaccharide deacetylase family protein [Acidimicrobiaceae bacterium]|nr:polysaccharide deacetylase family protein [Acidimicrobiaceae bacterium]
MSQHLHRYSEGGRSYNRLMLPESSVTLDVEDLRPNAGLPERVVDATHRVLDLFAQFEIRATVYVVGDLAERRPELVRRAATEGHEIGLHAWTHVPLPTLSPRDFIRDTGRGRALLQDLSGQEVVGYRAPMMSLVPEAGWVIPLLSELGFTYSSSVLPAPSPLYGWPGLPRRPFQWLGGPVEFPCPVVRLGPIVLPYLGGTYLRLLPVAVRRFGLRRASEDEVLWAYCHPWEFDPDELFHQHAHIGELASRIAWLRRSRMERQVRRLLSDPVGPPLAEVAASLGIPVTSLEVIDPERVAPRNRMAQWTDGRLRED